jgi:hypothetical protein
VVLLGGGLGVVAVGDPQAGTLMVWAGVLLFASAARMLRGPDAGQDDDGEGPGGGGGPGPSGPRDGPRGPAVDWDAFDRERESWTRSPAGVG